MAIGWYLTRRKQVDLIASASLTLIALAGPSVGLSLLSWVPAADMASFYVSIAGTAATLLGFVIAAATFLAAHVKGVEFYVLRASRSYKQLIDVFGSSMWRLAGLMFVAGMAARSESNHHITINVLALFATCYSGAGLLTLLWATLRILRVQPPSANTAGRE